jgi:predicted LPLAT superfamily acyltransferase
MSQSRGPDWTAARERGTRLSLKLLVWLIQRLGRAPLKVLLPPIATYYNLFGGPAKQASREYLARIETMRGSHRRVTWLDSYRHFYSFSENILDRLALWSGAYDDFEITVHGREHMQRLMDTKTGGFLVGAHLGSFDMLRLVAREANVPVNVLMYVGNAERINEAFAVLDPKSNLRVIDLAADSVRTSFEIRRCVQRGEFVAVLADRVAPGDHKRSCRVSLLGELATLPLGPFLIPLVLRIPAILTLALRSGPRRYDIYLETLSDGSPVPARERDKAVRERVERYASRLEHYCLRDPLQWFNFYDFWAAEDDSVRD